MAEERNTTQARTNSEKYRPVLAKYDVRAKQKFIYSSTHLKEIVGASWLIRDCFYDFLRPAAKCVKVEKDGTVKIGKLLDGQTRKYEFLSEGIRGFVDPKLTKEKREQEESRIPDFTKEEFEQSIEDNYIGEIVYEGGGNFFVVFYNEEVYQAVNRIFYQKVLLGTGTMRVLTSCVPVDKEKGYFGDYKKDEAELRKKHAIREREESTLYPVNTLPIVQVDYRSSQPLTATDEGYVPKDEKTNKYKKISYESLCKYKKYASITRNKKNGDTQVEGTKILDNLVRKKGEDSHLAIIYIDGNSMGAQVSRCTKGKVTYEECVSELRAFSKSIQKYYIDERVAAIDELLKGKIEVHLESERYSLEELLKQDNEPELLLEKVEKKEAGEKIKIIKSYVKNKAISYKIWETGKFIKTIKMANQEEGELVEAQEIYLKEEDVEQYFNEKSRLAREERENLQRRLVVYAGDEITFICNADYAYEVVQKYLSGLKEPEITKDPKAEIKMRSSCAGVAIFHSHAPFADAYRIAEECCESGKRLMKKLGLQQASFMDFQYCQGAIGTSLEDIRQHEGTEESSKPWLMEIYEEELREKGEGNVLEKEPVIIKYKDKKQEEVEKRKIIITKKVVEAMKEELNKIGHSNVKGLAASAKKGQADFQIELSRIKAHYRLDDEKKKEFPDFSLKGALSPEMQQNLIYDMVMVYDHWF